ncbi:apoptotic chromatin condensation inducer in the nucleus [Athalia rosae]|uniref:apoptotic chromatin condensation inducer in the nucleus n=1 Tax=Athalia rosae TaxID=37344 RepID=UPI0020333E13|nr:apoptotic chromatin condensation inducer in the nucleus [Athalia rosae]XP_048508533.1 apoptotic chromatin condensation inducer in the nucleus [Athalia rosae]
MRRKSERNKSKGSPEKKVEKATRKSTRKRGKRATSSSPEREDGEGKSTDVTKTQEKVTKDPTPQPTTRLKIKEIKTIVEEEVPLKTIVPVAAESTTGAEKTQDGGEGASVWKVARADASPGEIQKLKLCRQRNPSEASDSSSSRKKSHKSYESGEGDGEEGDSAEELPRLRKRDVGGVSQDDPSSSNPGQDSKEEVSHCREILPRTTSANFLSDDKQNVDRLADNVDQAIRYDPNCPVQKSPETNDRHGDTNSNGNDCNNSEAPATGRDASEDSLKDLGEGRKVEEIEVKVDVKEEVEAEVKAKIQVKTEVEEKDIIEASEMPVEGQKIEPDASARPQESSSDDERRKKQNPEPAIEPKAQTSRPELRSQRSTRRKHRTKYHESSDSDTQDSEDEPSEKKNDDSVSHEEAKEPEKSKSKSPSPETRLSFSAGDITESKIMNNGEDEERMNNFSDDKPQDEISVNSRPVEYKPAKVNLKRSFSARLGESEESAKKEDIEKNEDSETALSHVKENHGAVEETDVKNLPRRRRWGTTVTTEVTPAFTVSTDSLKALVPGAKPLSITEVKLSKDDDEEKERRNKEREKRHSISDDTGERKVKEEGTAIRNESLKRGDLKHENHIGAKRKISILKEAPHVQSLSPPLAKPTNVLLIKNLVRPFTLNQIKELLSRTGTIVENGFWIDGIKSKCYVAYSNEDQAFETRQALHGISWPVSNPKRLQVEYGTKEDMELARELSKDQPILRKTEPLLGSDTWQQVWARDEKQNVGVKVTTVREWDLGKEDGHQMKEKERDKKDLDKKRRQRSRSPPMEPHLPPPARKFKKKEDEPPPAKLLDDLFKKTKAMPCIYWLPLTNEQIVVKEEMRRQHMAEHARRLEEMKRAERSRDPATRRRRSPRK